MAASPEGSRRVGGAAAGGEAPAGWGAVGGSRRGGTGRTWPAAGMGLTAPGHGQGEGKESLVWERDN